MVIRKRAKLRAAIFKTGLRQQDVAAMSNMREARLSRIIHGYVVPRADEKKIIAKILKCGIKELWNEE